jgi:hypothetical protein
MQTIVADVNGDDRADLIWNNLTTTSNEIYVAPAKEDGTFDLSLDPQAHPVSCCWMDFSVQTADVDGNGRADLVWNKLLGGINQTYVGLGPVMFDVFVPMMMKATN